MRLASRAGGFSVFNKLKECQLWGEKKCRCILRAVVQAEDDAESKGALSSHAAGNGDSANIRIVFILV